jgi:ADP-heptose:LPS heptosyltransferase
LKPKSDIQNHWKNWLDTLPKKPKIGLFWRADISQLSYYHKKSNLKEWIELLNDLQIVIIPLQYGLSATEISLMHQYPDLFFTPPNLDLKNDIEGLSGLISGLDYVVTTAGTTQHIAGALNKTVLACVHPYEVYWRCNADATKDRFAPNVHILFSKPSEGIKGSMNVTVKKLKEMLTYE